MMKRAGAESLIRHPATVVVNFEKKDEKPLMEIATTLHSLPYCTTLGGKVFTNGRYNMNSRSISTLLFLPTDWPNE